MSARSARATSTVSCEMSRKTGVSWASCGAAKTTSGGESLCAIDAPTSFFVYVCVCARLKSNFLRRLDFILVFDLFLFNTKIRMVFCWNFITQTRDFNLILVYKCRFGLRILLEGLKRV